MKCKILIFLFWTWWPSDRIGSIIVGCHFRLFAADYLQTYSVYIYTKGHLGSVICFLYNLGWVKLISDFIGRSKIKIYIDSNDYLVYINNQPSSTGGHFNHMILNGAVKSLYLMTRLLDFLVFSCPFINFLQNLIESPTVTLLKPNLLSY